MAGGAKVPDLWWTPSDGCICRTNTAYWSINNSEEIELPADAVKLGDVDALEADFAESEESFEQAFAQLQAYAAKLKAARHELEDKTTHLESCTRANAQLKERLDALRADICAVLVEAEEGQFATWRLIAELRDIVPADE